MKTHDAFFKNLFSKLEEAKHFIKKTFPQEFLKNLDVDSLKIDTTNYVSNDLNEFFADVVYDCNYFINKKKEKIKISLLFEHKSYVENFIHLQLLKYLVSIWDLQIKQAKDKKLKMKSFRLRPVILMVFYHGKQKWEKKHFKEHFEYMDENLIKYLPKFDYELININEFSDEKIKNLFSREQLQASLLLLKNIFDKEKIIKLLKNIIMMDGFIDKSQKKQFLETISSYIYNKTEIRVNELFNIMESIETKSKRIFISTAMQLEMKGKKEGRREGILEGIILGRTEGRTEGKNEGRKEGRNESRIEIAFSMLKKKYPDEVIMELTGLDISNIKLLKSIDG